MDHCPAFGTELGPEDVQAASYTLVLKSTSDLYVPCRDCLAAAERYGLEIAFTRQNAAFNDEVGEELWEIA